ncbi:anti-sigma factor family protein [Rosistilla ulvae]|nr:zf-HC2 domain-containing protein [Rosistilla ulvae]
MSSNDCETVQQQLSAYHDGELLAGQQALVARHVEGCAACAESLSSYAAIGATFAGVPVARKPDDLWDRIESDLPGGRDSATLPSRVAQWFSQSPYRAGVVSMAAAVLLTLGLSLWLVDRASVVVKERHIGGAIAAHSHSHDGVGHHEHDAEFSKVMEDYVQILSVDPDAADHMLLTKYRGQQVDADGAMKLVGYRPVVSKGLPEGYSLASTSVLKMPCCTCVKAVCKRNDGSTLVLFEHDDEETAWFGGRRQSMAMCGDKNCCLVDLDSSIAATWKQGSRSVTAVGVRDQDEVAKLVTWLGKLNVES